MRKLLKDKKANMEDVPTSMMILFGVALAVILSLVIINQFSTKFSSMPVATPEAIAAVNKIDTTAYIAWDYSMLAILLGFVLFSILAARFIPTNPIYVVVGIIYMILVPFMAMVIGNVWDDMMLKSTVMLAMESKMPILAFLMDRLLIISIVYSAIIAIVLYSRKDASE